MPSRSSSSTTVPIASCRGSAVAPGIGREGGSTTVVARPRRRTSASRGSPSSGKRNASRTADPTSATDAPGGGGRSTRASSGAVAITTFVPASSGIRGIARDNRLDVMSPKTLTGLELELDDAPARDSELFLVDGNNLAYRAYFALPEELATTEGFPTNALLGFTNMLFKLLSDYKPK